jgi:hypothetical protein
LQNRPAKIRPAFEVGEAGMKHPHALPAGGFQFAAPQALVLPDGLDQPLSGELFIAQKNFAAGLRAPAGIKIFGGCRQAAMLLEFCRAKVNPNRDHFRNRKKRKN